jgi:catechol 2,3-dioxygenase-like lactoylglutathione lyase family enzyme
MFDHIGITVRDLKRSRAFYAASLSPLGIRELMQFDLAIAFGVDRPQLWLMQGTPVESDPRMHIAFEAATHLEVETFHRTAIEAGGIDNGKPGLRPHYHPDYYAAFVIDFDGHNLEAVCHRAP